MQSGYSKGVMIEQSQMGAAAFTEEEWAQTPCAVQEFVLALLARVQALETEVAKLRERANRNSRNSSQPPSSDGPDVAAKPRQRGAQPGHPGTQRKLVPPEQVTESYDLRPAVCRSCGHALEGTDPEP